MNRGASLRVTFLLIALSLVVTPGGGAPPAEAQSPPARPHLLFILTDDQRVDTLAQMPATKSNFDVTFSNGVVSTPLCCPARATFLTGKYAHNLGVWSNAAYPQFQAAEADSLGPWLQARGYYTGFMGKYLNAFTASHPAPPGWDEFYGMVTNPDGSFVGDGYLNMTTRQRYRDAGGVLRNKLVNHQSTAAAPFYSTRWFLLQAKAFIARAHNPAYNPTNKPWALFVWPIAPHAPSIAEPRYANAVIPAWTKPPSFLEPDMADKPSEITGSIHRRDEAGFHESIRTKMLRTLLSVDDLVRETWAEIDRRGEREKTWGVYASDNGHFWGEHHLTNKLYAYEEAARVPFRMAVPGIGPKNFTQMVSSIDVAPTLAALAGDTANHAYRGASMVPLVQGTSSSWRREQLIEARTNAGMFDALRTPNYTYVEWHTTGHRELYWRPGDPYELNNVAEQNPGLCDYFSGILATYKAA